MHWSDTRLNVDRLACPLMRETSPWPYCWVDRCGFMFKVCPSRPVNRVENECARSCGLGHCARRKLRTMVFSVSTATHGRDLLPPRPPRPFLPLKRLKGVKTHRPRRAPTVLNTVLCTLESPVWFQNRNAEITSSVSCGIRIPGRRSNALFGFERLPYFQTISSLRKWPARHYFGMGMHLVPLLDNAGIHCNIERNTP